ncbi:TPA: hypothetical protein MIG18_04025 [Klebsiella pneumoniae]|nr:hypothetical protein [Klebsiella pneumoniae]HCL5754752.1 hypothetical protein [Klebsiella pneumoniae]HCL7205305.1 hypothetical protein [Klebsiella pneumoniae]
MTTDITELAQSLKAAANKAKQANDLYLEGKITQSELAVEIKGYVDHLCNPNDFLALVEALEKAQETIAFQQGEIKALLSSLESRTVTVNLASRRLPSDYVDGEFGNDDLAAIHNACRLECKVSVEKYLSAHGIVVKWEAE